MSETISAAVRTFIIENFLFGDTAYELGDEDSLIDNDIIDSTGVLELVGFIEDRFGITMGDADIVPANLDSLSRITAFIKARGNASVAA